MATTGKPPKRANGAAENKGQTAKSGGSFEIKQIGTGDFEMLTAAERAFALAVAVMQEQVRSLPAEDRAALLEVIPCLFCDDADEVAAANKAISEILHQRKAKVLDESSIPLPDSSLEKWLGYISARIASCRKAARLTQAELAAKAGLPQSHISRLEQGQHSPTHKTLQKIADALHIKLADLDPNESRN